jgi:unsaturated chondroitin disaccharide hydrolase
MPYQNPYSMTDAIQSLFDRMDSIEKQCGDAFPLYSIGNSDQWLTSQGGSWMGGFWAGCWWLRARLTQSNADYAKALVLCEKLSDKIQLDSSYRSLIFWYGAALGDSWFQDHKACQIATEATKALVASYDTKLQCMPLGTALGGGETGKQTITVDGLASLIDLLTSQGDREQEAIAKQHTDTLLAACLTETGAFHSEAHYVDGYFQATDIAGDWSRGQAWAMLGLTSAAQRWGEPYLTLARSACHYWLDSRQPLALNRLSEPTGLNDPSATVIAALAMLTFAEQVPDGDLWRNLANQQLHELMQSDCFANGLFSGCCYKIKAQEMALVESSWGIFLLLSALMLSNQ